MIVRRVVANVIDVVILIMGTAAGVYGAALLSGLFGELSGVMSTLLLISQVCVIVLIPILLQALFWVDSTTIGKSLVFTEVRKDNGDKLDGYTMFAREYLSKVLTCYFGCLPIAFKKPAIYEASTQSRTTLKPRK